jgi:hypothetical protein
MRGSCRSGRGRAAGQEPGDRSILIGGVLDAASYDHRAGGGGLPHQDRGSVGDLIDPVHHRCTRVAEQVGLAVRLLGVPDAGDADRALAHTRYSSAIAIHQYYLNIDDGRYRPSVISRRQEVVRPSLPAPTLGPGILCV